VEGRKPAEKIEIESLPEIISTETTAYSRISLKELGRSTLKTPKI